MTAVRKAKRVRIEPAVMYGYKGAGIGSRARREGRVMQTETPGNGGWVPASSGRAYQVRCADWVRQVGTEWYAVVGDVIVEGLP